MGACGLCGKDPVEGLASISLGGGPEVHYCHGDDERVSCYEKASRHQGDVVGFVLARIAERAEAARHADWAMQGEWFTTADDKVDEFVRLMSPERVLADCEAKRRIVELHADGGRNHWVGDRFVNWCLTCRKPAWPCPTLRVLAGIWSDHPDYRDEWENAGQE